MKQLILLAIMMIAFATGSFAQSHNDPISIKAFKEGRDTVLQVETRYHASITYRKLIALVGDTMKGNAGVGSYYKYRGTGKEVAFIGVGLNNSGHFHLHDSTYSKGFQLKDTLGTWYFNSYKNVSYRAKAVEGYTLDTFGTVSFDSCVRVNRLVQGTSGTDSMLAYNATTHNVVKIAPQAWIKSSNFAGNGTGAATTFTLTIASGNAHCVATSEAPSVATAIGCSISGTTLTVTTSAAPIVGTGNVKFSVVYW